MKLLKKLAISTFAFAAFSFIACDNPSTGVGEPDSPVVDAGSKTITVAITADEAQVSDFEETVYAYLYYGEGENAIKPFGGWPGKQLTKNDALGIWYVTEDVSSFESLPYSVIFNNKGSKQFSCPSITVNESKLYTRARTWIDWDKTSADTTEAYVAPEVPTEMTAETIAFAVDVSDLGWADDAPYIWGWGAIWTDLENEEKDSDGQTKYSPFYNKGWGSDAVKLTQLEDTTIWYFIFSKDCDTTEGHYVQFIPSDKSEPARIGSSCPALEAGKGYLLKEQDGEWITFTSFDELKSE